MGNKQGKLLKIDAVTNTTIRGRFAWLCVQLDTIKPLPKSLRIDTFWQDIVYENVLVLCFHCGWIGHRESTCSKSSGGATQSLGCSWENPDLKNIYIYNNNNLNFFICLPLKKIGTLSSNIRNTLKIFMPNKF